MPTLSRQGQRYKTPGKPSAPLSVSRTFGNRMLKPQSTSSRTRDPCECTSDLSEAVSKVPRQHPLGFDTVLSFSVEVSEKCKNTLTCEHCCSHWHAIEMVRGALDLTLTYLEGACATYAIAEAGESDSLSGSDFPERGFRSFRPAMATSSAPSAMHDDRLHAKTTDEDLPALEQANGARKVCSASPMTWGEFDLDGEEAQLLARVVLRRALTDLAALIGQLQYVSESGWHWNHSQASQSLQKFKVDVAGLMERLVLLVALLE